MMRLLTCAAAQSFEVTIYVIGAALIAAVALVTFFVAQMTELLVKCISLLGWTPDDRVVGRFARWALHRRVQHHMDVLKALGIDDIAQTELRRAALIIPRRRKQPPTAYRPDEALVHALKPWVCKLEYPRYRYPETKDIYIDSMGAVHFGSAEAEPLTHILAEWVHMLIKSSQIDPFHCVITNKLGNVEIAQGVCNRINHWPKLEALRWKPEADSSRVTRDPDSPPHPSDFEGLSAFLNVNRNEIREGHQFRAVGLDDNVTGGSALTRAIEAFNQLVVSQSLPFKSVDTAVVLFRVQKPDGEEIRMEKAGIRLHALLSLGQEEIHALHTRPARKLCTMIGILKKGYGCEVSRNMWRGGMK